MEFLDTIKIQHLGLLALAYLIGSIPSAVWVGKAFFGVDVRNSGSKNSGATNTFRVIGKKAGIPVLLMDILKGYIAVMLAHLVYNSAHNEKFVAFQMLFGTMAVFGHILPVFARFKGGKGIATLLGVMLAIEPMAAVFAILAFIVSLVAFSFVSLASITGTVVFASTVIVFSTSLCPIMVPFSLFIVVLVISTHQKNIQRMFNKEEGKVSVFRRK